MWLYVIYYWDVAFSLIAKAIALISPYIHHFVPVNSALLAYKAVYYVLGGYPMHMSVYAYYIMGINYKYTSSPNLQYFSFVLVLTREAREERGPQIVDRATLIYPNPPNIT